jgi:hypothetical protein
MFNGESNFNVSMRDFNLALVEGVERVVDVQGSWFHVQKTQSKIQLQFNESPFVVREEGQGGARDYNRVTILSETTQNVILSLGFGQETDARVKLTNISATVSAAETAGNPITLVLSAGQTAQLLPRNSARKSAYIVRGENDLYNIKIAYKTAQNAQDGLFFAPQSSVNVEAKEAVFVHNHSDFTQSVVAIDTNI